MAERLLEVRGLRVTLGRGDAETHPVDRVDLSVDRDETVFLVGESGCGKSLTALAIPNLLPQPVARISEGEVRWKGRDLAGQPPRELRRIRGREIGFVFQEPQAALNPVIKIGKQVVEAVRAHGGVGRAAGRERALALLGEVGIPSPTDRFHAYPHQLSGGMQQRVCIAMALACRPSLLIADEPTTALDVTVQAQVLALLARLQTEHRMALLIITHDLALVAENADRVAVMYAGRIVEEGPVRPVFRAPRHPYTRGLLDSLPDRQPRGAAGRLHAIPGTVPSFADLPAGCRFHPRCERADEACRRGDPTLAAETPGGPEATTRHRHAVACFHPLGGAPARGDAEGTR